MIRPANLRLRCLGYRRAISCHFVSARSHWIDVTGTLQEEIKVEDEIYEMTSSRVTDAALFARFADKYEEKYGNRPRNENIDEIYLLQLVSR